MKEILSRCGYRCDLCLAYKPNIEQHPENAALLSDGWFKFYGFRVPPAEILCDGCDGDIQIQIDSNCPVRPCVIEKSLENCATCAEYICPKLKERIIQFDELQKKQIHPISKEERQQFIFPYESLERLESMRKK